MINYYKYKTIVLTGASSGIGEAILRSLSNTPCTIFIGARSDQKLNELKQELESEDFIVNVLPLDLSDHSSLETAFKMLSSQTNHVDLLINNGGVSQRGYALETDFSVIDRIMQVNFLGTVKWTTLCLELLQRSEKPQIIVNSSVVGEYGFPLRSAYAASKHALKGYFQSMQLEPDTPDISIVSAGGIQTNISKHALDSSGKEHGKLDPRIKKGISPEKAAQIILKGASKKKKNIFIGLGEVVLLYISRYIPPLYRKIASNISAQ